MARERVVTPANTSSRGGNAIEHCLKDDENPLVHYLAIGREKRYTPNPLFDISWYEKQLEELPAGVDPLLHYLNTDSDLLLSPHPLINPVWIQRAGRLAGDNILKTVLSFNSDTEISTHRLFDPKEYRRINAYRMEGFDNSILHYLSGGWKNGFVPRKDFDPFSYRSGLPATVEPLTHLARTGTYPDIVLNAVVKAQATTSNGIASASFANSELDSSTKDIAAKLLRSGLFDPDWYCLNNYDVARAKVDPLQHS